MAQRVHRKPVTLTLDPDVRQAADQLLAKLPVKVSLSSLVNELLEEFVVTVGPSLDEVMNAEPAERVSALHSMTGRLVGSVGVQLAEITRAIEEKGNREE